MSLSKAKKQARENIFSFILASIRHFFRVVRNPADSFTALEKQDDRGIWKRSYTQHRRERKWIWRYVPKYIAYVLRFFADSSISYAALHYNNRGVSMVPFTHHKQVRRQSAAASVIGTSIVVLALQFGVPLVTTFFLSSSPSQAAAGIEDRINFQGRLTNELNVLVADGNYDMIFRIFDVSSGGTAVWTETWDATNAQVNVTAGLFSVLLGTYVDLPGSLDFNTNPYYLDIQVKFSGAYQTLTPRVQIGAAVYSFNSDTLDGVDSTGFVSATANDQMDADLTIDNTSTAAFKVRQNAAAADVLTVDTTNRQSIVGENVAAKEATLLIHGTNSAGLEIQAGGVSTDALQLYHNDTDAIITTTVGQLNLSSAGGNIDIKLGDAAGVNKFRLLDSGSVEVLAINSDGKFTTTVDAMANTIQTTGAVQGATGQFTTSVTTPAVNAYNAGANGNITLDAKGTGTITFGATSTGDIFTKRLLQADVGIDVDGGNAAFTLDTAGEQMLVTNPDTGNNTSNVVVISNREATTGGNALVIQQEEEDAGKYALQIQDYNAGTPVNKFLVDNSGTLTISGNITPTAAFTVGATGQALTLQGSTITLNGTTSTNGVDITLDADNTGGAGVSQRIIFERGTSGSDVALRWNETADQFALMTVGGADAMTVDLSGNATFAGDLSAGGGYKVSFLYHGQNISVNNTDVVLNTIGTNNTELTMPYAGSILAVSVFSNEARTSGSLTVEPTVNGVKSGLQATLDATNTTSHQATQAKDTDTFAAGDELGIKLNSTGWAPITADITIVVIVDL